MYSGELTQAVRLVLFGTREALELAVELGRDHEGLVLEKVLPHELEQREVRVFLEQALREGVLARLPQRVAAVQDQVHVLGGLLRGVLAKGEEVLAEELVLDDFADVQFVRAVVLRKRVVQVGRDRGLVREKFLAQLLALHEKQVRLLIEKLGVHLSAALGFAQARILFLFARNDKGKTRLVLVELRQDALRAVDLTALGHVEGRQRLPRVRKETALATGLFQEKHKFLVH